MRPLHEHLQTKNKLIIMGTLNKYILTQWMTAMAGTSE